MIELILKNEVMTSDYLFPFTSDFSERESTNIHNMSADELSHLQHNFNALQAKFVHLVTEKADLLEKLQENEHLIVNLSYETETIGV